MGCEWREGSHLLRRARTSQVWYNILTGPVALKGVARASDAQRALGAGFKAIWVSNHGGRQLEDSVAPFDVLPEVREAVGPDVEVIVDGGVRRGLDIVKVPAPPGVSYITPSHSMDHSAYTVRTISHLPA